MSTELEHYTSKRPTERHSSKQHQQQAAHHHKDSSLKDSNRTSNVSFNLEPHINQDKVSTTKDKASTIKDKDSTTIDSDARQCSPDLSQPRVIYRKATQQLPPTVKPAAHLWDIAQYADSISQNALHSHLSLIHKATPTVTYETSCTPTSALMYVV
jgi:hypothetical protein